MSNTRTIPHPRTGKPMRYGLQPDGELVVPTPRWALPLLPHRQYKGGRGGRASGKSHFFAERMVEHSVADPHFSGVCLREVQRSLRYSAKRLVDAKIRNLGVAHLFDVRDNEIRRKGGSGVIIFQGMQDHTADSIKSLEDFSVAWYEEAQRMSLRSRDLLLPTIERVPDSELWFSWNPDQPDDPVEDLLVANPIDDSVTVTVNYGQNPFRDDGVDKAASRAQRRDPDSYPHIWLGEYNTKSDDQVLAGKWRVDEFEPEDDWDGPYFGEDFGFSTDPGTLMEVYIHGNTLYVYHETYAHGIETDHLPAFHARNPRAKGRVIRADNARPENISYLNRHGWPRVEAVRKWPGSVEDGISKLRGFDEIVIHVQCPHTAEEARLWKYKRDRLTDEVLPTLIDKHNHTWDAIRYAIEPLIKRRGQAAVW